MCVCGWVGAPAGDMAQGREAAVMVLVGGSRMVMEVDDPQPLMRVLPSPPPPLPHLLHHGRVKGEGH